jgi:hypothetical protein
MMFRMQGLAMQRAGLVDI